MNKRTLIILFFLFLLPLTIVSFVRADDTAASKYLHFKNMLPSPPGTSADLQADLNSPDAKPKYYEFAGRISGQVTSDNQPVVLVDCIGESFEVQASQSFLESTDWMDTGSVVRMLVKTAPNSDSPGGSPALVLICAGPETSISTLEKKLAEQEAQIAATAKARMMNRSALETSREMVVPARYDPSLESSGLSDRAASIYPAYHDTIARLNPSLSENNVATITKSILYYSDAYQLDPRLIVAMVIAESDFDPSSVSRTGAVGLGQLMPDTAAELGVSNAFDPVQNIAGSVALLSSHVQRYGGAAPCGIVPVNTLLLTMAAYNAGPGAVKKYGGVPPYRETQQYVRKVSELYKKLCGI